VGAHLRLIGLEPVWTTTDVCDA